MGSPSEKNRKDNGATIGFEAKLWRAADKLRNNMDAAEYKHVALGLIFLKYISNSFEEMHARLSAGDAEYEGANPEDQDENRAENVFWIPKEASWSYLQASAKQPTIGRLIDDTGRPTASLGSFRSSSNCRASLPGARRAMRRQRSGMTSLSSKQAGVRTPQS
jgi:type I restriction enzyme M protein